MCKDPDRCGQGPGRWRLLDDEDVPSTRLQNGDDELPRLRLRDLGLAARAPLLGNAGPPATRELTLNQDGGHRCIVAPGAAKHERGGQGSPPGARKGYRKVRVSLKGTIFT
jgi:hypothetical protein